jgi:hypothetical protein
VRTLPLTPAAAAGERRPLAPPDAGRRPWPRRASPGITSTSSSSIRTGGCVVVVHGDNGVTIDGVAHAAGARVRWQPGQKLVLGDASPAAVACIARADPAAGCLR